MAIKVVILSKQDDDDLVDWVVKNCNGFLYSVATEDSKKDTIVIELFFATNEDALMFNLKYF